MSHAVNKIDVDEIDLEAIIKKILINWKQLLCIWFFLTSSVFSYIYFHVPKQYSTQIRYSFLGARMFANEKEMFFDNKTIKKMFDDYQVRLIIFPDRWNAVSNQWRLTEKTILNPQGIPTLNDLVKYIDNHIKTKDNLITMKWTSRQENAVLKKYIDDRAQAMFNAKKSFLEGALKDGASSKEGLLYGEKLAALNNMDSAPLLVESELSMSWSNIFSLVLMISCLMACGWVLIKDVLLNGFNMIVRHFKHCA